MLQLPAATVTCVPQITATCLAVGAPTTGYTRSIKHDPAQRGCFGDQQASGWVAATRLICSWTPEDMRGAALGALAFSARVSLFVSAAA